MVNPKAFAEQKIKEGTVVVFSKTYCPYCVKVKQLFKNEGIEYEVIELDERDDGGAIQQALVEISGQRTVPNVFIKGQHVGGCDDTHAAHRSGKLQKMLAA